MSQLTAANRLGLLLGKIRRWPGLLWRLEARFKGVEFRGRADILGRPLISVAKGGRIVLGDKVKLFSSRRANMLSLAHPCTLRALGPGASVVLADGVGLSGAVVCAGSTIEIGEQSIVGADAMIIDNDFHRPQGAWGWNDESQTSARPIRIGRGVFIGARAIVLKGVTIGDRAVVGAGAVVTRDVPAGQIAAGNPAQLVPPRQPAPA